MSEEMDMDGAGFTLADLGDLDISDIEEIRYESLPAGAYGFKIVSATLDEKPNRDQEQRFIAEVKLEVVEVKAVIKKGVELESLIGKTHTEKFYIVPEKAAEGIGRVRANFTDMGIDSTGKFRDVLDRAVGHTFFAKIKEQKDKEDPSRVYARLVLEPAKK